MIRVRNRHNSHIARIAPGEFGYVDEATVKRYPWALIEVEDYDPADDGPDTGEPAISAREARHAIATAADPEDVRPFLDHPNANVRSKARRRLTELAEADD